MSNQMAQLQEATIKAAVQDAADADDRLAVRHAWRSRRFARSRATSGIWKHCCWPRSKSGNATRSNGASRKRICRE